MAIFGLFCLAARATINDWSRDDLTTMLQVFALYLLVIVSVVPTLYASWATRPAPIDDEDGTAPRAR